MMRFQFWFREWWSGVRLIIQFWKEVFRPTLQAPPLGKKLWLHQRTVDFDMCVHCGKPLLEWKDKMDPCPDAERNFGKFYSRVQRGG